MAAAIACTAVSKRYANGVLGLDEVTLEVLEGSAMALLGQNGAGKSTLLKLVLGLLRPSAGRLVVLGEERVPLVVAYAAGICLVVGRRFAARDLLLA